MPCCKGYSISRLNSQQSFVSCSWSPWNSQYPLLSLLLGRAFILVGHFMVGSLRSVTKALVEVYLGQCKWDAHLLDSIIYLVWGTNLSLPFASIHGNWDSLPPSLVSLVSPVTQRMTPPVHKKYLHNPNVSRLCPTLLRNCWRPCGLSTSRNPRVVTRWLVSLLCFHQPHMPQWLPLGWTAQCNCTSSL